MSEPEFERAAERLAVLVDESVAAAVEGESRIAVAFSGGLDSSVVALCASRRAEVVACTAYSAGSGDSTRASRAAVDLGIRLVATELNAENVGEALSEMTLPYEPTLMDRSLWSLYSVASRGAKESGARVILLGQLADELFGGYAKYLEALESGGEEAVKSMMAADAEAYKSRGRVRDLGACGRWAEARLPFEAVAISKFADSTPVSFKLRQGVRKAVLRRAASRLGLPASLAEAPKKAAQYSSGVQKLLTGSHF